MKEFPPEVLQKMIDTSVDQAVKLGRGKAQKTGLPLAQCLTDAVGYLHKLASQLPPDQQMSAEAWERIQVAVLWRARVVRPHGTGDVPHGVEEAETAGETAQEEQEEQEVKKALVEGAALMDPTTGRLRDEVADEIIRQRAVHRAYAHSAPGGAADAVAGTLDLETGYAQTIQKAARKPKLPVSVLAKLAEIVSATVAYMEKEPVELDAALTTVLIQDAATLEFAEDVGIIEELHDDIARGVHRRFIQAVRDRGSFSVQSRAGAQRAFEDLLDEAATFVATGFESAPLVTVAPRFPDAHKRVFMPGKWDPKPGILNEISRRARPRDPSKDPSALFDALTKASAQAKPAKPAAAEPQEVFLPVAVEQLNTLRTQLNAAFLERSSVIDAVLMALLARKNVLLLGDPGTAKSLLIRAVCKAIDVPLFIKLLTRQTKEEEVFGPVSISALRADRYERNVEGFLPTARVCFADEIFKASSAILNSLLTIMNEREYDNGGKRIKVPLDFLAGASNELPEEDSLAALYDRFMVRVWVDPISVANTDKLLTLPDPLSRVDARINLDALLALQKDAVVLPTTIATMKTLRERLAKKALTASDRRWRESVEVLKAAALLRGNLVDGKPQVEPVDCMVLSNVLWSDPDEIERVRTEIVAAVNAARGAQPQKPAAPPPTKATPPRPPQPPPPTRSSPPPIGRSAPRGGLGAPVRQPVPPPPGPIIQSSPASGASAAARQAQATAAAQAAGARQLNPFQQAASRGSSIPTAHPGMSRAQQLVEQTSKMSPTDAHNYLASVVEGLPNTDMDDLIPAVSQLIERGKNDLQTFTDARMRDANLWLRAGENAARARRSTSTP